MPTPPQVVDALADKLGKPFTIHTAIPPFHLGGELVDVGQFPAADGEVIYATCGLAAAGSRHELMLHAEAPDGRFAELMARLGGSTRTRSYQHGGTLPLSGPTDQPPPYAALGFMYSGLAMQVDGAYLTVLQVFDLTADELAAARGHGLYTVEAAWWRDGRRRLVASLDRPTSASLAAICAALPGDDALAELPAAARAAYRIALAGDTQEAELVRDRMSESAARALAPVAAALPHPTQLVTALHACMDYPVAELRPIALAALELDPDHHMAGQYYADALAMLAAIDGESWEDAYFKYEGDFAAARARRDELSARSRPTA